jgi:hypothetical protein
MEDHVSAVHRDSGANLGVENAFDFGDVGRIVRRCGLGHAGMNCGLAAFDVFLDESGERLGESFPVDPVLLGHGNEVAADINASGPRKAEQFAGKWRLRCLLNGFEIRRCVGQVLVRDETKGLRVRSLLGANEVEVDGKLPWNLPWDVRIVNAASLARGLTLRFE